MVEQSPVFDRRVLGLIGVLVLMLLLGSVFAVGPGRSAVDAAGAQVAKKQQRLDNWEALREAADDTGADQRSAWEREYSALERFGVSHDDQPSLMAHVAGVMRAPSVAGLEVTSLASEEEEGEIALEVLEPYGEAGFAFSRLPMRVRFDVRYGDLFQILSRIQAPASGLVLQSIEFRRHYPGVKVDLVVDLWTRLDIPS